MAIPGWSEFLAQVSVSGGIIALVLLDLIIHFTPDSVDAEIERMKPYLAMLLAFLVPQVIAVVADKYPTVDPYLWAAFYSMGAYAVHEVLYRLIQKPVTTMRGK